MRARIFQYLQRFLRHRRFPYLVALVGFADMFLFIVPNDLLMLSEAAASPGRRKSSVLIVSTGSALGAMALAYAFREGASVLLALHPGAGAPLWWASAREAFERYGDWALFFAALAPIPVQPFVAGALFTRLGLPWIFALVLVGRLVKYSLLAFVPSLVPARFRPAPPADTR